MKKFVVWFNCSFLSLLLAASSLAQQEFEVQIQRSEWPQVPQVEHVVSISQLRLAVQRFIDAEEAQLIIRYPGGDAGNQWAIQVHDMLVTLGIESDKIEVQSGSGIEDTLLVVVYENYRSL